MSVLPVVMSTVSAGCTLPPGASQLPTMPATSDNGAQPLANACGD